MFSSRRRGTQEVRVVNAWHQPKPTDTILCTIAAVRFFFCTAPSVTEVRCVALGRSRPGGAQLQGRVCRPPGQRSHCMHCLGMPQQQSRAGPFLTPRVGAGKCSGTLLSTDAWALSAILTSLCAAPEGIAGQSEAHGCRGWTRCTPLTSVLSGFLWFRSIPSKVGNRGNRSPCPSCRFFLDISVFLPHRSGLT